MKELLRAEKAGALKEVLRAEEPRRIAEAIVVDDSWDGLEGREQDEVERKKIDS